MHMESVMIPSTPTGNHRRLPMLRVKVQSLGAEIRLIRDAEQRMKRHARKRQARGAKDARQPLPRYYNVDVFRSLRAHQRGLSAAVRIDHLAACALRGTPYARCETPNARDLPSFERIVETALRFGGQAEPLAAWLHAAQASVEAADRPHDDRAGRRYNFERALARVGAGPASAITPVETSALAH